MRPSIAFSLVFTILLAGVTFAWSEPSFWNKGTPTPVAPKPPQVAPIPVDENETAAEKAKNISEAVEAPVLGEPMATPTPVLGRKLKSPTKAGLFSAVLPGSGHVYAGQPVRGLLFAGVFGVTLWKSLENFKKNDDGTMKNSNAGQLYGLAALLTYGFAVEDAYDSANRYNRRYHLKLSLNSKLGPHLMIARSF
jgi:hypothetical protein